LILRLQSKVERVVLNALAIMRLCRRIFAPLAIPSGIVFGEADPPFARQGRQTFRIRYFDDWCIHVTHVLTAILRLTSPNQR
jgi:hypothetical protein